MNSIVGDRYIAELVQIFDQQGSALYTGQHSLCLTAPCLHYIQRKMGTIQESSGSPIPAQFTHLQQLQQSFSRIVALKLITDKHYQLPPSVTLSLAPFKAIHSLTLKKVPLTVLTGLSRLRSQIRSLVIQRCGLDTVEEVIIKCGADDSTSFSWACLKEVDFSHNKVAQLGESLQFLTAIEKVDLSNNSITEDVTGIEYIDGVTFLHLGFNQLKAVPVFGPRAKFNLTGLNLRNNQIYTVEGLQELDSLTELDLTDNLLTRHSDLQPLQNLHNLCILSLIGNPLSFHPKHRLKSVEVLSNLINPTTFRLDSKKLTSKERKAIPHSLTHYPRSSPSLSSNTSSVSPLHIHTLTPQPNSHLTNGTSPVHHSDAIVIAKRRRKKQSGTRVVALHDSDEEQDSHNDTSGGGTATDIASSVPLKYERRLQKMKDLAKQMPDKWLLSKSSLDTTSSESNQKAHEASRAQSAQEHHSLDTASMEKAKDDNRMQSEESGKNGEPAGVGGVEPRTSTPITVMENDGVSDECFVVERYESDVEEGDEGGDQILLTLSDRFLEEKDTNGVVLDRMDLGCLMTAVVEKRAWKSAQQSDVLVLQFSHERRDRRRREYVMIEENHDSIMGILAPISEDNQKAFSLASKVECFTCQRVFDATESKLMPLLSDPYPPTPPQPHSLEHKRTSLANRFCPFCKSQRLHYINNDRPFPAISTSTSPRIVVQTTDLTDATTGQPDSSSNKSGFSVSNDTESSNPVSSSNLHRTPNDRDQNSSLLNEEVEKRGSLDSIHTYDRTSVPQSEEHAHWESSEYIAPLETRERGMSTSSWSFGESSGHHTSQHIHSSHDVLYHSDVRGSGADVDDLGGVVDDSRHDIRDTANLIHDTGDTIDSRSNARDTGDSTHSARDTSKDTQSTRDKYTSGRRPSDVSDLSRSGGKSSRLTNSEPTPKVQIHSEVTQGQGTSRQQSREFRRQFSEQTAFKQHSASEQSVYKQHSASEQSVYKQHSAFEDRVSHHPPSTESAPSLSRMRLHPGDLGSVQEQPTLKSRNPFDKPYSTNPFDEERANPFDMEGDRGREEEREEWWREVKPKERAHSFSRNEEKYFSEYKSHRTRTRERQNEYKTDLETPIPRRAHSHNALPRSSTSVPVTSYMRGVMDITAIKNKSRAKKSSTLPHGRSPNGSQRSPELSKKSTTLPHGKPPLYELPRGKSLESLESGSPKHERHPAKFNKVSPLLWRKYEDKNRTSKTVSRRGEGSRVNESRNKMSRITSAGDLYYTGDGSGRGSSSGERDRLREYQERGRRRSSADESQTSTRSSQRGSVGGSSSGGGGRLRFSASGGSSGGPDGHHKKLSSSESSGRPLSTSVLLKDEDPCYIHNSLHLHLDMEVFSTEQGEHFKMIFRAPMVQYNSADEVPSVAVFSNINTFIYRMTAPQSSQPDKWLSLQKTLPLSKLVYLDVGPFHQFLRLEFSIPGACFTFLLRDKEKCRTCLSKLSMIVSDCPRSSFKSVGICSFRLESISHPDRALRGAIMTHYDNIKTASPKSRGTRGEGGSEDDCVKLYLLAHRHVHMPGKKHSKVPVTVVVAGDIIYIGQENFHHWPVPRLQELPPKESLEPPFSGVEHKQINDIEEITMDPDQKCQIVLRFFKESVTEGENKYWCLTTELDSHVRQLVRAIKVPWESMFETALPIIYK